MEMPSASPEAHQGLDHPGRKLRLRTQCCHPLHVLTFEHDAAQAVKGILGETHKTKVCHKIFDRSRSFSIMKYSPRGVACPVVVPMPNLRS